MNPVLFWLPVCCWCYFLLNKRVSSHDLQKPNLELHFYSHTSYFSVVVLLSNGLFVPFNFFLDLEKS